jgi:hypothetical protein
MVELNEPRAQEPKTGSLIDRVRRTLLSRRERAFIKQRDKIIQQVQPFLRPQEQAQRVFIGTTGPSPYIFLTPLLSMLFAFMVHSRLVAVTNRSILVFSTRAWGTGPKALLHILPRKTGSSAASVGHLKLDRAAAGTGRREPAWPAR